MLGLIVWGTAQFASYAAFGHRRPINAVVVIGLLLLGQHVADGPRRSSTYIVVFSIASLFLLVRFHTLEEQGDWLRRRIGDPTAISALYLRGGTVFIIAAITGSLALTNAASSAPLAGAWTDVGSRLVEWGQWLQPFLPDSGSGRSLGPTFGDTARIGTTWHTNDDQQVRVTLGEVMTNPPFLATHFYDVFDMRGWRTSPTVSSPHDPNSDLLSGTGDDVNPDVRRDLTATITPSHSMRDVFLPVSPRRSTRASRSARSGRTSTLPRSSARRPATRTRSRRSSRPRRPTAAGPRRCSARRAPTIPRRSSSSTARPRYRPARSARSRQKLLVEILKTSRSDAPYDVAARIRDVMRDSNKVRVQHRPQRRALRGRLDGRVLREDQEGLLPVVRDHDGRVPARARHPGAVRPGLPARPARRRWACRSPSVPTTRTPGCRPTSRDTAGSTSTRPAIPDRPQLAPTP